MENTIDGLAYCLIMGDRKCFVGLAARAVRDRRTVPTLIAQVSAYAGVEAGGSLCCGPRGGGYFPEAP